MNRIVLLTGFIILCAASATAVEWQSFDVELGFSWIYSAKLGSQPEDKTPSALKFTPGVSVLADLNGVAFKPSVWFTWGTDVVWSDGSAGPVTQPVDSEPSDHMTILGMMLDAPFGYNVKMKDWTLSLFGGPALYLRFPLWTAKNGSADPNEFWTAYYGKGQFLHLSFGFWAAFPMPGPSETILSLGLRSYLPMSHLWIGVPFQHGIMVSVVLGLRFDIFSGNGEARPDLKP